MKPSEAEEIVRLCALLSKPTALAWISGDGRYFPVVSVTERANEPGPCANFAGGMYVNIENADYSDFIISTPLGKDNG